MVHCQLACTDCVAEFKRGFRDKFNAYRKHYNPNAGWLGETKEVMDYVADKTDNCTTAFWNKPLEQNYPNWGQNTFRIDLSSNETCYGIYYIN